MLLGIEFFLLFPLDQLGSHQIESVVLVYDILCRNSQDENGEELFTFDQVSYEVKNGKVFNNSEIPLSFNDFFIKMLFKDKLESSMRPKCFCLFIFATTVPLNVNCG